MTCENVPFTIQNRYFFTQVKISIRNTFYVFSRQNVKFVSAIFLFSSMALVKSSPKDIDGASIVRARFPSAGYGLLYTTNGFLGFLFLLIAFAFIRVFLLKESLPKKWRNIYQKKNE